LVILNVKKCFYEYEIVNKIEIIEIIEKKISKKYKKRCVKN